MIKKTLNQFKKTLLVMCSIAILTPSVSYANTSNYAQDSQSTEIATYAYDAFGRRVAKTVHGSTTYYIYSGNQLIAELNEAGEMTKAYGWDFNDENSSSPLWQADITDGKLNTAEYHTLINDHLGTPQMAVNDKGEVTWEAVSESFGKTIPDHQNKITMNLRFPGQYYDEETGTHYNYFRDYNPNTGRYIQKDPIGLEGGINWYGYVQGNPLKYTDPTGEAIPLIWVAYAGIIAGLGYLTVTNLPSGQYGDYGDATTPPFPVYEPTTTAPPPAIPPTTGVSLADICIGIAVWMAKGGHQNIENEYSRAARNHSDPCAYLDELYRSAPNSVEKQKIKLAQKALNCRRNSSQR